MKMRTIALAFLVMNSGVAVLSDAMACSPSPEALNRPLPTLEKIQSSHPIVFVGTVMSDGLQGDKANRPASDPGLRYATFKIEIPLKGTEGLTTIRVRNRGGGDCYYSFGVGERWLFAGDKDGALYSIWSGSTLLADGKGDTPEADQSEHEKALRKAIPQIAKLPPPEVAKPRLP